MTVSFLGYDCVMVATRYAVNDRFALQLFSEIGELIAVATVNLPDYDLPDGCVAVKNYSENEGMWEALVKAGIIEAEPRDFVNSGYVSIPIGVLTPRALDLINEQTNFKP